MSLRLPLLFSVLTSLALVPCACATPMTAATQGYTYGYPVVLMDLTREGSTGPNRICGFDADLNSFKHLYDIPDPDFTAVVRPNVDTLYSSAFLDLSEGPMVLEMPPTDDRYVLMALFDAWSNNFAGLGTPSHGTTGGRYLIAHQDWNGPVPEGFTDRIDSPTPLVWIIGRTEVRGPDDRAAANAVQDGLVLEPLLPTTPPPSYPCQDPDEDTLTPPEQIERLDGVAFMERLDALLAEQGALPGDEPTLERLATIGVGPYAQTTVDDLGPVERERVNAGRDNGQAAIDAGIGLAESSSGWSPPPDSDRVRLGEYGTDYYVRAVVAQIGFGANKNTFAVYQNTGTDADGTSLDGEQVYTLTFPAGQQPPVDAFWSVTVYDEDGYLTGNALDRYALGSNSGLVAAPDGSTTLTFSHTLPPGVPQANWLPTPASPFQLTLRMYAPDPAITDGTWSAPDPVHVVSTGL